MVDQRGSVSEDAVEPGDGPHCTTLSCLVCAMDVVIIIVMGRRRSHFCRSVSCNIILTDEESDLLSWRYGVAGSKR